MPEEHEDRPVANTDWFGRSISVAGVLIAFCGMMLVIVGVYLTLQIRVATNEYQLQQDTAAIIELKSRYDTNQSQMEAIRVQLALINEKLTTLTSKK